MGCLQTINIVVSQVDILESAARVPALKDVNRLQGKLAQFVVSYYQGLYFLVL